MRRVDLLRFTSNVPRLLVSNIDVLARHEIEILDELWRQGDDDGKTDLKSSGVGRKQTLVDGLKLSTDLVDLSGAATARIGASGHSHLVAHLGSALNGLANVADDVGRRGRGNAHDGVAASDFLAGTVMDHGHQTLDGRLEHGRLQAQLQLLFPGLDGVEDGL